MTEGLPDETREEQELRTTQNGAHSTYCTLRGTIWKLLLGAFHMDSMHYIHLVEEGPTSFDSKIRNDTFRTFQGDEEFWSRVTESQLARVLNAFVRLNSPPTVHETAGHTEPHTGGYVQVR